MTIRDKNGREIRPGDIIRIFHYIDRWTKRRVYMHKLVLDGMVAVGIVDIWLNGFEKAHRYRLTDSDAKECEIIDGALERLPDGRVKCWYERPRMREATCESQT